MRQELEIENVLDEEGRPTGGSVKGVGLDIRWQDGPLGTGEDRQEPNGAFVEGVIESARRRLQFFQEGPFACEENVQAIIKLREAERVLDSRTKRRQAAGIEGTHAEEEA